MKDSKKTKAQLITELEELQKQNLQLRNLTNNSNDMLYRMSLPDGNYEYISPASTDIYGYSPEEFYTSPMLIKEIIPPGWHEYFEKQFQLSLTGDIPPTYEHPILHKSGETRWVNQRNVLVYGESGNPIAIEGIVTDITEQKRAAETQHAEYMRFVTVMDSLDALVYVADIETYELLFVNGRARNIFGNVLGKTCWKAIQTGQTGQCAFCTNDKLLDANGKPTGPYVWEFQNTIDGEWYQCHDQAILWPDGRLVRIEIATNITERKQAEEALQKSEFFLRESQRVGKIGSYSLNVQSGNWASSETLNDIFEIDENYTTDVNGWAQIIHPEDRAGMLDYFQNEILGNKQRFDREYRIIAVASNRVKWVHGLGELKINEDGIITEMIGTIQNINERKKAEEESERVQAFMQTVIDGISDSLMVINSDYTIALANRKVGEMTGGKDPVAAGLKCHQVSHKSETPCDCDNHYCPIKEVIDTKMPMVIEHIHYDTQNRKINVEVIAAPIFDEKGEVVQVIESSRDITERKKLEEQFAQSQKMESVGRLAGGVAHDFNNMLAVIIGNTELAQLKVDSSHPLHADLQEIHKAAERSADLTRQLLAFARKQTVLPIVLDINETIAGMLKMLQRLIGEEIELALIPGPKLWSVKMDPSQIDQLLANLCVNARDAIDGVGKITIETENTIITEAYCSNHVGHVPGEYTQLVLNDSGCGMDEETLMQVFEPFFTTKDQSEGTGLGLSTVYGIVKQNNGFINVISEPGHGTTIIIHLPRYVGKTEQIQANKSEEIDISGRETVLMVEDEPAILNIGTKMLEGLGYRVLTAATPGEAIELAEIHTDEIHLLLTDVVMPEMNGRVLAKRILSLYPGIKRLFMSGYTADLIAHHGVLDEGVHFIQKPFSMKDMAVKVREALDESG